MENCTCGHTVEEHESGFSAHCEVDDCDCPCFEWDGDIDDDDEDDF